MADTTTKPYTLIALRHSGTHLVQPLIRHLTGKPVAAPKGRRALDFIPGEKCVVWLRDPRHTLVSHFRYKTGKAEADAMGRLERDERLAAFMVNAKKGQTPIGYLGQWAKRWVGDYAKAYAIHAVRFEEIVGVEPNTRLMRVCALADYLLPDTQWDVQIENSQAAIAYAIGQSVTWTGRHSRHAEWFGPASTKVWNENKGPKLLARMGYE